MCKYQLKTGKPSGKKFGKCVDADLHTVFELFWDV